MARYADIIVDLSLERLDKTFQYEIPESLRDEVSPGVRVEVPFGSRSITGYVVEVTDEAKLPEERIRPITDICRDGVAIESHLIALAGWMRTNYGSTMNQALKTVLPVHRRMRPVTRRRILLLLSKEEARRQLALYETRHYTARARLLRELIAQKELDYTIVTQKLNVSPSVIHGLEERGVLRIETDTAYRNPIAHLSAGSCPRTLNEQQRKAADRIISDMQKGIAGTYLLKGVTGSGKTEVYMELIAHTIEAGRQAIVLIPEISLTYQTVMRFYGRFGDRISIMNSRMSQGERYDQYLRAKNGDIDIIIGPRSALFAPFPNLGIIIIDEEHEAAYKSETSPRYHARETAIERARMSRASVVLGSATPSIESYYRAQKGEYELLELTQRVEAKPLPECEMIDLRQELREGNRSILSVRLQELMEERLQKGQQIMLFINRRGVSSILSCRACGNVVKCPHCDVSMSVHNNGYLVCHYCGHRERIPQVCPSCGSRHIAGFKAGTQKVEELVQLRFPEARILRMDYDTTRGKDSYEKLLQAFADHEADILIGTQMIVKGHDFPDVTLMGILAADMSLHVSDYRAAERTFQLLTQAAGRAGRGTIPGRVIVQTYSPEHYAIQTACRQDYEAFYRQEIAYRSLLSYPPVSHMLVILASARVQQELERACACMEQQLRTTEEFAQGGLQMFGPAEATIARVNDVYRMVIYLKSEAYGALVHIRECADRLLQAEETIFRRVTVQYDFDPMNGF